MKVKELNGNWKAIHMDDRTILKVDLHILTKKQIKDLESLEVEDMHPEGYSKGHYKAL